MCFLHKLWDETLAGPAPDSGLGKLRKYDSFSASSTSRPISPSPPIITRSITIVRTSSDSRCFSDSASFQDSPSCPITPRTPCTRLYMLEMRFQLSDTLVLTPRMSNRGGSFTSKVDGNSSFESLRYPKGYMDISSPLESFSSSGEGLFTSHATIWKIWQCAFFVIFIYLLFVPAFFVTMNII